jgi:hypothetical protein
LRVLAWFRGFVVRNWWGPFGFGGRRFKGTDYISRVSGLGDGAGAVASFGVGGVSGAAGCEAAAGRFFWALVAAALRAAALRMRVFAALRPAARCLRVAADFLAAAVCLRVAAAFFPALFRLGLISSSVTIRKGIRPEVACLCKTCLLAGMKEKRPHIGGALMSGNSLTTMAREWKATVLVFLVEPQLLLASNPFF